jgi:agmatine deiminase
MKKIALLITILSFAAPAIGQDHGLPRYMTAEEKANAPFYRTPSPEGIPTPPPGPIRTMAEWEEVEYLTITWTSYRDILAQIVDEAQDECIVIITCSDSNSVISDLANRGVPNQNLRFIEQPFNSIWIRDYGQNSVYMNDVDSLVLVDWIYNRPRAADDQVPVGIANEFNYALYSSTQAPSDLVHTGGNFMSDGTGIGFSSDLVVTENGPTGQFNQTVKTASEVDTLMKQFMNIDPYVRMDELPFDIISHIDMHMKLINENTLLVGKFPTGVSDGPQMEANIQYILSNFTARDGNPFNVIRVPMPPSTAGNYAPNAHYRTYSNSIFINKTVLVPTYREEFDTTALRIYRESLPGFKIVPINSEAIIPAAGAIHCITHSIGVRKPLLIQHWSRDTIILNGSSNSFPFSATVKHEAGISGTTMFFRIDTAGPFTALPLVAVSGTDEWSANLAIPNGGPANVIQYYFSATSTTNVNKLRPLPAPEAYFETKILPTTGVEESDWTLKSVYPNPASAVTCIPVHTLAGGFATIELLNSKGQKVDQLHRGTITPGTSRHFFNARSLSAGTYTVVVSLEGETRSQKVVVVH